MVNRSNQRGRFHGQNWKQTKQTETHVKTTPKDKETFHLQWWQPRPLPYVGSRPHLSPLDLRYLPDMRQKRAQTPEGSSLSNSWSHLITWVPRSKMRRGSGSAWWHQWCDKVIRNRRKVFLCIQMTNWKSYLVPQFDKVLSTATEEGRGEGWTPGNTIYWRPDGLGGGNGEGDNNFDGDDARWQRWLYHKYLTCAREWKLRRKNVLCCRGEANPVAAALISSICDNGDMTHWTLLGRVWHKHLNL